ncbi:ATP-grasp domain-containing protein [Candidatus Uhrbacteria bacterium]|nr:ATP-grasp domain-containing protein [Candidatus Uhrbacteria bacterium]
MQSNSPSHRILLNCAGSADFTPIIRDFETRTDITLLPADAQPDIRLSSVTNRYVTMPQGSAPEFIDELFKLALKEKIDFIIPKADEETFALIRARKRFEEAGIKLAIQDDALLPILESKSACYRHLTEKGFPVPSHTVVRTAEELEDALRVLDFPNNPILMKPDASRGGRGVCVVATSPLACQELIPVYHPEFAKKILDGSTPYICMVYRKGIIYDIDILNYANGETFFGARGRFTNITKLFSGNFFSTDPQLLALAKRVYDALPTRYLIDYDILLTEEGEYILLEINPRPSGSTVSYLPFGTNLYYVLAKSHLDGVHLPIVHPPHGASAIVCFDMIRKDPKKAL